MYFSAVQSDAGKCATESYINYTTCTGSMTPTLEHIHREVLNIKKDVASIKRALRQHAQVSSQKEVWRDDEGELRDEVVAEIKASQRRKRSEFISHEDLMRKYHVQ